MIKKHIYLAAPLSKETDRGRNLKLATMLRAEGYIVEMPQEFGVYQLEVAKGRDPVEIQKSFVQMDIEAMHRASICLGYMDREKGPSEGMIWEMGYMYSQHKPTILFNPHDRFKYGTILAYTAYKVADEGALLQTLKWLSKQEEGSAWDKWR